MKKYLYLDLSIIPSMSMNNRTVSTVVMEIIGVTTVVVLANKNPMLVQ